MTTGLTYATYKTQIATMAVVDEDDTNYAIILPQMITFAENMMCRKLDFLFTRGTEVQPLILGTRQISLPSDGTFVTLQQANIITPVGTTDPELGARNPCLPVTKEWLDFVYGDSTYTGIPKFFCPFTQDVVYFGPFPDAAYSIEIVGTTRPESLSDTNPTSFISAYLPDIFIAASMIYLLAYQRDFGRVSDDPASAVTWQGVYDKLMTDAMVEEARKRFAASAWTSEAPAVVATPDR